LITQFSYDLRGSLDLEAFEKAWGALIDRHASLRTAFVWERLPHPVQAVRRRLELPFEFFDLRGLSEPEQESRLQALRSDDRKRGFDLLRAPLMRLTVIRRSDAFHSVIGCTHHMVVDRLCIDALFEDLAALYLERLEGRIESSLPAAGTFKQYIAWIQRREENNARAFWLEHLADFRTPSLLGGAASAVKAPAHRKKSSTQCSTLALSKEQTRALHSFARASRLTLGSILQGAIALWLAKATHKLDVVFGLTVSGRPLELADCESTVGSFINNLPLRVRITPESPLVEWLTRLQAVQIKRNPHEYVSPARVKEWTDLGPAEALFDLLVLINPSAPRTGRWPGLEMSPIRAEMESAYPNTLLVGESEGRLELSLLCRSGGLSSAAADASLAGLATLLDAMRENSSGPLADIVDLPVDRSPSVPEVSESVTSPAGFEEGGVGEADDDPERVLVSIWSETLGFDVGLDEDLIALGVNSMQIATVFIEIERRLGRAFPLSVVFRAGSIRDLLRELDAPVSRRPSLVAIQRRGSRPPIFTVPGIGGNVVGLAGLARALGPDQPFFGLESKGLDGNEAPISRIEDVAAHFVSEMLEHIRRPYVLFGICWGSAVAYEMAQLLRAQGLAPDRLIMLDPTLTRESGTRFRSGGRTRFVVDRLQLYREQFIRAGWHERLEFVREKRDLLWRTLHARETAPDTQLEINQLRVADANLEALGRYRHRAYRGATCLLFTEDRPQSVHSPESEVWRELLDPTPSIRFTPGVDTGDALASQNLGTLVSVLEAELDAVEEAGERD
jgi:thioesterase domain-containing protein